MQKKRIIFIPTPGTISAGFLFSTALNEKGEFVLDKEDIAGIILLKRHGAKEKKGGIK